MRGWTAIGMLALAACTAADERVDSSQLITAAGIEADTRVLSADEMEGRAPGTPGEEKSSAFIERRFREAGLSPVAGSYRQGVVMVGTRKIADKSSLSIRGPRGTLRHRSDETLTYWSSSQKDVVDIRSAPLLFVGYGVEAPEHDWDDFKGVDVSGKVLLFLNDDPPVTEEGVELFGGERRTYYGRWTYKFEQAMKHGAAGAVMIHTTPSASYPFSVVQRSGAEEGFALDIPDSGYQLDLLAWIDEAVSEAIAQAMGTTLEGLFETGSSRDFKPVETGFRVTAHIETAIRRVETDNVIGMLEGSDPRLRDQIIVFSAHYDHLGRNDDVDGEDKIFNGAWDNAVGTAAIISLAAALARHDPRPRRSFLFLACAAEESGSLGSRWFVTSPPFPRNRLVADFNIDMPQIFGVTTDLAAIGVESSTLGEALRQVASAVTVETEDGPRPLRIRGDPRPRAGSFYRSDQVNFAKAGIPALFLNPGVDFARSLPFDPVEYRNAHYHQVSDEITERWDLTGLERDLRVFYGTALLVANAEEMPLWVPGNEFEEEWKALHAK